MIKDYNLLFLGNRCLPLWWHVLTDPDPLLKAGTTKTQIMGKSARGVTIF
jgi:hypothetical protein